MGYEELGEGSMEGVSQTWLCPLLSPQAVQRCRRAETGRRDVRLVEAARLGSGSRPATSVMAAAPRRALCRASG